MIPFEKLLEIPPFFMPQNQKDMILTEYLVALTEHHQNSCAPYSKMLKAKGLQLEHISHYRDLPFLPVGLFKTNDLYSISKTEIFKTLTSSGTSGQAVSKIYLDRETANRQQKTLVKIVSSFLERSRLPMLVIDCPSVIKNRTMFSARGAGILGFSIFGKDITYALTEQMELNRPEVEAFLQRHSNEQILLFGFTFMIWRHFYQELLKLPYQLDFSRGVLIHGGGWKKLASEAISPEDFSICLKEICGIQHVHNYYGMVEQTGCIYMECEKHHLHASIFSDVLIRKAEDFSLCQFGEPGIIQVVSMLPFSYPGHNLITEDKGILLGIDDCPCGRKGAYFKVLGRLENAEIRGCSDTYAITK